MKLPGSLKTFLVELANFLTFLLQFYANLKLFILPKAKAVETTKKLLAGSLYALAKCLIANCIN